MKINYSDRPFERPDGSSIFLIGPTPRSPDVQSWRPEAVSVLRVLGFGGTVYYPEPFVDWETQTAWEYAGTERAGVLAAWVPREMNTLPGLTTNVEFGLYVKSGRLWYGRPEGAANTRYLDWVYERETRRKPATTLAGLLTLAVAAAGKSP